MAVGILLVRKEPRLSKARPRRAVPSAAGSWVNSSARRVKASQLSGAWAMARRYKTLRPAAAAELCQDLSQPDLSYQGRPGCL